MSVSGSSASPTSSLGNGSKGCDGESKTTGGSRIAETDSASTSGEVGVLEFSISVSDGRDAEVVVIADWRGGEDMEFRGEEVTDKGS